MNFAQITRKYSSSNFSPNSERAIIKRDKINSTLKWVEYAADIITMTNMLRTATSNEKYKLVAALEIAERKKNWHYRQENFDLNRAGYLLSMFKNAK
jgi:hypothetical protein